MRARILLFVTALNLFLLLGHFAFWHWQNHQKTWIPIHRNDLQKKSLTQLSQQHREKIKALLHTPKGYDSELGWCKKVRSRRKYSPTKSSNTFRVACFGDSFVYGDEVELEEVWTSLVEAKTNIECINLGVSGYGLDQAYLRYKRDGIKYNADVVIIGYMLANINRHVSMFRPFLKSDTGIPLTKPRFVLKNDNLSLVPNPYNTLEHYKNLLRNTRENLLRLGALDYHYKKSYTIQEPIFIKKAYNPKSKAITITYHLFDLFYKEVQKNNSYPLIVIFPDHHSINKIGQKRYKHLTDYIEKKNYTYIDLFSAISQVHSEDLWMPGQHYSPKGNKVVAQEIISWIKQNRSQFERGSLVEK